MPDELWEPFSNNLDRWLGSLGSQVRLIRGHTSLEQEQQIIDNLAARDPAALPWASAEDSPYPDGLAATVFIPEEMMTRARRTATQYGIKVDPDRPWHVEPLGLRGGAFEVPGVPPEKHRDQLIGSSEDGVGKVLDTLFGRTHYGDKQVVDASKQLNQRRVPLPEQGKKFLRVMGRMASNDNYNAIDPDTGALGRWQIRPKDWAKWSREVFGESIPLKTGSDGQPILPSPNLQDRVAAGAANNLFDKYKDWNRVASVWHGGKAATNNLYPDQKSFVNRFRHAWMSDRGGS